MCFSAGASFTTAVVLTITGILTLFQVRARSQFLFALIPLFFALQQFAEGFVWVALGGRALTGLAPSMSFIFLFFAFVIWPTWIPLSLWALERNVDTQKTLGLFLLVGLGVSAILGVSLWNYTPSAQIVGCHIMYSFTTIVDRLGNWPLLIAYCLPTIGSFLVAESRILRLCGICVFASAAASYIIWSQWFTSVWCFFAAALSVFVYVIIRFQKQN